ncbi:MAG TPA: porin family protein [Chitinophagaceae bacterium]|nr:porin family protein [Chitinophagaceae bacterium]
MKKLHFFLITFALLSEILSTGCTELHQMAEASLDENKINYKGPSPYPPPLGTPTFNLQYLFLEELVNDIFWPISDLFYDSNTGTAYALPNYDPGDLPYYKGYLGASDIQSEKKPKWCLMLADGLSYVGKGAREKDETATTTTHLNYIEVPVIATYYARIGKTQNAFHLGVGPWIAYALNGKFKTTGQNSVAIKFGKNGDFTRMDYGAGFRAGLLFSKKWDATVGYDMGINNLIGTPGAPNDGDKAHTQNFSLSIGYWFR